MSADVCHGCGLDYFEVGLGDPCPCEPVKLAPRYRLQIVQWRATGTCADCGDPLDWRPGQRGRPPIRCSTCSPHRRAWAAMTPAERTVRSRRQVRRLTTEREVDRRIDEALVLYEQRRAA